MSVDASVSVAARRGGLLHVALSGVALGSDIAHIVLCFHGLNASSATFEPLFSSLSANGGLVFAAVDLRGHGLSAASTLDSPPSTATLLDDAIDVALEVASRAPTSRGIFLVGHSLGGAIATRLAASWPASLPLPLRGLVAIESCEGSTCAALPDMRRIFGALPRSFASAAEAVSFIINSGAARSTPSAHIAVPPRLREDDGGRFVWRAQAFVDSSMEDESTWVQWFASTTTALLSIKANKLLIVSSREHLFNDRALTVALTQGKLQTLVVPRTSHSVHEDDPAAVAAALAAFFARALTAPPTAALS